MLKTILVKPNGNSQYETVKDLKAYEPPLWHVILADYYKADAIIDAEIEDLDYIETIGRIIDYNPQRIIILPTGSHPSAFIQQKETANNLKEMLALYSAKVEVLDCLPVSPTKWNINWNLVDLNKYSCHNWHSFTNDCNRSPYGVIYTNISCSFKCNFCTVHNFYGNTFEQRTLERIAEDFKELAKRNVKNIKIMDELFIFNKARTIAICDDIIKNKYDFNIWAYARIDIMDDELLKKLRQAGVRWLAYGIESGSERIRKDVLKGSFSNKRIKDIINLTKDNDICIIGNYMFGFWEDNLDTLKETYDLAVKLNCEFVNFYCLTAYPNTPFYDEMLKKGIELPEKFSQYAQTSSDFKAIPTKYLSAKEVLEFRDRKFEDYFSNSSYLNMMRNKFGDKVIEEINKMLDIKLIRK